MLPSLTGAIQHGLIELLYRQHCLLLTGLIKMCKVNVTAWAKLAGGINMFFRSDLFGIEEIQRNAKAGAVRDRRHGGLFNLSNETAPMPWHAQHPGDQTDQKGSGRDLPWGIKFHDDEVVLLDGLAEISHFQRQNIGLQGRRSFIRLRCRVRSVNAHGTQREQPEQKQRCLAHLARRGEEGWRQNPCPRGEARRARSSESERVLDFERPNATLLAADSVGTATICFHASYCPSSMPSYVWHATWHPGWHLHAPLDSFRLRLTGATG